jgi:hypothetical protein
MKPHETIADKTKLLHMLTVNKRPPRRLEVADIVEGVTVPYVVDEAEYLRRIEARDKPRQDAKARCASFRAQRTRATE